MKWLEICRSVYKSANRRNSCHPPKIVRYIDRQGDVIDDIMITRLKTIVIDIVFVRGHNVGIICEIESIDIVNNDVGNDRRR